MATTADAAIAIAQDAVPADGGARVPWRRAIACGGGAAVLSFALMVACVVFPGARPGSGEVLLAAIAGVLVLSGVMLSGRAVGDAAIRVACATAFTAAAVGAAAGLGIVQGPQPAVAAACAAAALVGWRVRRPEAWRLSDTLLAVGAGLALTAIVTWGDPESALARLGTQYPGMRPISAWVALAIGAASWASHHRYRRLGWVLLGAAALPLACTFLGRLGLPMPSAWLWSLGLLPTPDAPIVGNYSDAAFAIATLAVALRLRDPREDRGVGIALSRGLGVAIASVSGMAVIGLVAALDSTPVEAARSNISLTASLVLFTLGAAIAVDRAGAWRDSLPDALPLAVALALGGLYWWGTTGDRDAFERRAAASELAQIESLLRQDLARSAASIGRLSWFVDALPSGDASVRFMQQAGDLAKQSPEIVHVRAYARDSLALAWGLAPELPPGGFQGPPGIPVVEAVAGGWWILVPGETGTAAFVDRARFVDRRLASHEGAPMRARHGDRGAGTRRDGYVLPIASHGFDLGGHRITIDVMPDENLRGFVLSRTAVIGALSAGLLISFVLFLLELARARAEALVREVQRRAEASEELARAAAIDGVTGLPRFSAHSSELASILDRPSPEGWLILIDLDAFASLNDALGHEAGDEILRALARRLAVEAGSGERLLRFGGEGFALIGTTPTPLDALKTIAERLRRAIGEPVELASTSHPVKVTASIGIARMPEHGMRLQALLRNADLARHAAKRAGRNQAQVACVVDEGQQRDRLAMTAALRDAIERGEIRVAYQPIVDVDLGRITGFEALARWHHPQWGDVPPAQFIPLAESSGLMERLGEGVMRSACARLRGWHALGHRGLSISINVSPSQLGQGTLPALVESCLHENGLDADVLTLEVTESMLIEDVLATAGLLEQLKRIGLRLALDDFGTGYSSLAYLQRLPLDVLKIDRSFVRNVVHSENDTAIVRMIMALSEQMRLQTVAEGVEDEAQQSCLREMGCTRMQGYRFARPCFSDEATALLLAYNGTR